MTRRMSTWDGDRAAGSVEGRLFSRDSPEERAAMHRIMTDWPTRPTRRRWLRVTIGLTAMLIAIGGVLALSAHRRDVRRQELATEVIRAGGVLERPRTLVESFQS